MYGLSCLQMNCLRFRIRHIFQLLYSVPVSTEISVGSDVDREGLIHVLTRAKPLQYNTIFLRKLCDVVAISCLEIYQTLLCPALLITKFESDIYICLIYPCSCECQVSFLIPDALILILQLTVLPQIWVCCVGR